VVDIFNQILGNLELKPITSILKVTMTMGLVILFNIFIEPNNI